MLNAGMVNVNTPCANRAYFCAIFLVFGRILHFKKPVKYNGTSRINLCTTRHALHACLKGRFLLIFLNNLQLNTSVRRIC